MPRKKVIVLCPYPFNTAPSQRFRFEQYINQAVANGIDLDLKPFFTKKAYMQFSQSGNFFSKITAFVSSYLRRLMILLRVPKYDFVFIHREATPAGPPVIEWFISVLLKKKIIYDFDDAIWLSDNTAESHLEKVLRWRHKVGWICKQSYKVSCGNAYLAAYASQFNAHVNINPTTIDTEGLHNPSNRPIETQERISIGWTGSRSTLKYLEALEPMLNDLQRRQPFRFVVIADRQPQVQVRNLQFYQWSEETEIQDLQRVDIGIMPLPSDEWTKGKCGFKALQYMALEIPAVVSPVGVNTEIVEDGVNGFVCSTNQEWLMKLERLILDRDLRRRLGHNGRRKVQTLYSVEANTSNFLSLFQ